MKLFKKAILSLCIIMLIVCVFSTYRANAAIDYVAKVKSIKSGASADATVVNPFKNIGQAVVTIIRIVAVGVAILMLIVLAMKYMAAAPSERASIKKSAIMYVIGAIVMFAAAGILGIIQNFANNINT